LGTTLLEDKTFEMSFEVREKPPSNKAFLISLITPAIFIFILIILFPIIIGLIVSFRNSTGVTGYFGDRFTIDNFYWALFQGGVRTRDFWQYTYQTLFFASVSLIIEFILGIMFARLLNKKFRGRGLARATILIPWALPTIASATIFRYEIFAPIDQFGLLNNFLELLSLRPVAFFGPDAEVLFKLPTLVPYEPFITDIDITTTMFTAIAIDVWKTTPFLTLLILAVLQIVPEDLDKAADIAGANSLQKFRYITWPLIRPGVGVALVFRMMDALRVYDAIIVFRDKEVRSMTWHAANFWLTAQEYGLASVVAIMLFLFIIGFALLILKFSKREKKPTRKGESLIAINKKPRKEESTELSSNNIEMKYEQDLTSIPDSKVRLKEFSESKIKLIRIRLIFKKGLFAVSVIFMCLFCAAPFIWIIVRSFNDPFIPQTTFEYRNLIVAITFFLFIVSLFFIVTKFLKGGTKKIKKRKVKRIKLKEKKYTPKELLDNDSVNNLSSDLTSISQSETNSEESSESNSTLIRLIPRILILIGSVIIICIFGIILFGWLTSNLTSFGAFQVVFETSEFTGVSFGRALLNGFLLSGLTVVVVLIIGSLIAYALAKFDFSGKFWLNGFIFTMTSLPPLIIIIPFLIQTATISNFLSENRVMSSYIILILGIIFIVLSIGLYLQTNKYKKKHLIATLSIILIICISSIIFILSASSDLFDLRDSIFGLVFPYSALNLPLAVFVLQAFFREIPEDLWKAAKVDGASNFQIFRKIILPLTVPGIFTVAILVFISSWNELLFAQIWLVNDINHTVPRAILRFVQSPLSLTANWDTDIALMAATTIATVPLVVLVLIFQKKIISGLTRGAVKG
jgi:ABC-type glycerol-3-phosphate transport system permease component